ncbi:hypothetical protein HRI_000066700 [Hibiscus trionum]|uniref:Reverse transcriptase domain-containing protein n=1 Tax=Hibiscus trionum TaxID=183268 RepID=A0A9W7GS98_HIBTR|nr:hypothetical protein HRI_000066700 [Hibiscus trionum]
MGFGAKWKKWLKKCISFASISVLINGSTTNSFKISKGLRQGCPLSPLLFNVVAEGLSSLLNKAVSSGYFTRVRIGDNDMLISHLQFADDLIVFRGESETEIKNLVRILRGFEIASGLKLNLKKSKIIGINVDHSVVEKWASTIHYKIETLPCKYLGLPLGNTSNLKTLWSPI